MNGQLADPTSGAVSYSRLFRIVHGAAATQTWGDTNLLLGMLVGPHVLEG
jgi:hypothetical protein